MSSLKDGWMNGYMNVWGEVMRIEQGCMIGGKVRDKIRGWGGRHQDETTSAGRKKLKCAGWKKKNEREIFPDFSLICLYKL